MSMEENRLSLKIDVDMSEFDEKIDEMYERLDNLKKELNAVNAELAKGKSALIDIQALAQSTGEETARLATENALRRQAAMLSK